MQSIWVLFSIRNVLYLVDSPSLFLFFLWCWGSNPGPNSVLYKCFALSCIPSLSFNLGQFPNSGFSGPQLFLRLYIGQLFGRLHLLWFRFLLYLFGRNTTEMICFYQTISRGTQCWYTVGLRMLTLILLVENWVWRQSCWVTGCFNIQYRG